MAGLIHFLQGLLDKDKSADDSPTEAKNLPCDKCKRNKKPCKTIRIMRKHMEYGHTNLYLFIEFLLKTVRENKAQAVLSPFDGKYFHLGSFPQFKGEMKLAQEKGWLIEDPGRSGWFKVEDNEDGQDENKDENHIEMEGENERVGENTIDNYSYTIDDYECPFKDSDNLPEETDHEQA